MIKILSTPFLILLFAKISMGQVLYDFSTNPLSNGWAYYDDYSSMPVGFSYDNGGQRISYNLSNSTQISFIHTPLPYSLVKDYCISFKIRPTNSSNYNSFFPLLLSPNQQTGVNLHPWRMNAPDLYTAGPIQNLDLIGVEVLGLQIRFLHRNNNIVNSTTIQPFLNPFIMQANQDYWVKITVSNYVNVNFEVYNNALMSNALATRNFNIPQLSNMNHLYIANCNGNSATTQNGYLDDYKIETCNTPPVVDTNEIIDDLIVLEMPNVFTPNSDLINEFYTPIAYEGILKSNLTIMNRWGQLLFETEDVLTGWDGKFNNELCTEGVYFWKLFYTTVNAETATKHGFFHLIR